MKRLPLLFATCVHVVYLLLSVVPHAYLGACPIAPFAYCTGEPPLHIAEVEELAVSYIPVFVTSSLSVSAGVVALRGRRRVGFSTILPFAAAVPPHVRFAKAVASIPHEIVEMNLFPNTTIAVEAYIARTPASLLVDASGFPVSLVLSFTALVAVAYAYYRERESS